MYLGRQIQVIGQSDWLICEPQVSSGWKSEPPVSAEAILWPLHAYSLAHTDTCTCTPRAKEQSSLVTLFHQLLEFLQQPESHSQTGKAKMTWMFSDSILRFKRPHFPGWRDGPVLKSTCCSYRGFKLGLQYSYGNSQSSLTLIPG